LIFFFLRFSLAHMLADFPLQTDYIFRLKSEKSLGTLPHILIHMVVMVFFLLPFINSWRTIGAIIFISVFHMLSDTKKMDVTRIIKQKGNTAYSQLLYFGVDQAIHFITIILAVTLFYYPDYYLTPLPIYPEPVMSFYLSNTPIIILIFIIFGMYGTPAVAFIVSGLFFTPDQVSFKESWKNEILQKIYRLLLMVLFLLPGNYVYFAFIPLILNITYVCRGKHKKSYVFFKDVVATMLTLILAALLRFVCHHYC